LVVLFLAVFAVGAQPSDRDDSRELHTVDRKTIRNLVSRLASTSAAERGDIERRLIAIGPAATGELNEAISGGDRKLAARASKVLAALPKANHWLQDASGKPIPKAALEFFRLDNEDDALPKRSYAKTSTDDTGGFAFPPLPTPARVAARVVQPDYGISMIRLSEHEVQQASDGRTGQIRLPLVTRDSDHGKRSVIGKIVDERDRPVFGAEIRCTSVRTPGEGLIDPLYPLHNVLTAKDGSFRLYLPNREPGAPDPLGRVRRERHQRGKLIPENSRFNLEIRVPHDSTLFPAERTVGNTKPATIRLRRATLEHQFEFEAPEGGLIGDAERLKWIVVAYRQGEEDFGSGHRNVGLDRKIIRQGGLLLAGDYSAEYRDTRGRVINWQRLTVTKDSPERLRFTIPPPVVYAGRVVDGITGKPVAGAFVGGWSSTRRKNFALVTPAEWTELEKLPAAPSINETALKPLLQLCGFISVVRTGQDGRFRLIQTPQKKFYGVMAFARDRLPFEMGGYGFREQLKKGPNVDTGDFPLFPAARLRVHPVFDQTQGRNLSISPHWQPLEDGQPDWFAKFEAATNSVEQRQFGYVHWLKLNEAQPILVPADVRLRVLFRCPYDDKWVPGNRQQVFQVRQGAEADFGQLTFQPAVEVQVRVVGPEGSPVEGAPVRRLMRDGQQRAWSVAHNSDANGIARFHVPPNATGQFGVYCFLKREQKIEVRVDFETGESSPDEPFRIELTEEQIEKLLGRKR